MDTMQSDWKEFLAEHTADITPHGVECATTATVLCDLSQFGTLRVSGEEAQAFLQNLFSNDIREVSATRAQFSSFNTAKGRMLATFLIWRDGDDYLLQLPATLTEAMRKKLSMYVLRAKVKITDAGEEVISLGLSGDNVQEILLKLCESLPESPLGVSSIGNQAGSLIKYSDTRFQISTTPQQAITLVQTLGNQAKIVGSVCWDWLNIRAGLAVILPQTQEQFVPQMANLDLTGGINFKKGCYPGQEIVARMHYLGKLKRRMYLAHIASETAPQAGDELFSADMAETDPPQPCGMIANAAPAPNGGYDVLAVIQIASHDAHSIHLGSLQGAPLQFMPLPYSL
ncbi:MAG: folate-binding protein [Gallionella sp.]|nr:folate-binding protein [Gallionella sp.]